MNNRNNIESQFYQLHSGHLKHILTQAPGWVTILPFHQWKKLSHYVDTGRHYAFVFMVTDLVVLGDQDAGPPRFKRHFLHRPEHVRLYREGELQTQITDVVIQDPLQVLCILWINGRDVLVAHRDTWWDILGCQQYAFLIYHGVLSCAQWSEWVHDLVSLGVWMLLLHGSIFFKHMLYIFVEILFTFSKKSIKRMFWQKKIWYLSPWNYSSQM